MDVLSGNSIRSPTIDPIKVGLPGFDHLGWREIENRVEFQAPI